MVVRYESQYTSEEPHKKSGGQLGDIETTTNPSKTEEGIEAQRQRGEQTAENIRYGQTISEGGMSGFTTGQSGEATQGGYGQQPDQSEELDGAQERRAAGYGGSEDQSREIGG